MSWTKTKNRTAMIPPQATTTSAAAMGMARRIASTDSCDSSARSTRRASREFSIPPHSPVHLHLLDTRNSGSFSSSSASCCHSSCWRSSRTIASPLPLAASTARWSGRTSSRSLCSPLPSPQVRSVVKRRNRSSVFGRPRPSSGRRAAAPRSTKLSRGNCWRLFSRRRSLSSARIRSNLNPNNLKFNLILLKPSATDESTGLRGCVGWRSSGLVCLCFFLV